MHSCDCVLLCELHSSHTQLPTTHTAVCLLPVTPGRQVNLLFVRCILLQTVSFLMLPPLLSQLVVVWRHVTGDKKPVSVAETVTRYDLLEAINANGLLYFLLANLLTGAVNLSTVTMSASTSLALTELTVYVLTLSLVVSTLYVHTTRLKFWWICTHYQHLLTTWLLRDESDLHLNTNTRYVLLDS